MAQRKGGPSGPPAPLSDAGFAADPNYWPRWPLLPLVERGTGRAGFLVDGQGPRVFVGNVVSLALGASTPLSDLPTVDYPDLGAVVEAWRID
jgi:hypothetical protein